MTKDYVTIDEKTINILGHKVKAITERCSDEYLDNERFKPRCYRCCFFNKEDKSICSYIRCDCYSIDLQIHFELI